MPRPVLLVVEDDADARDAIAAMLEDAGYDVLQAANGLEALGRLGDRNGRCDLILLDLMMPVMNGWDFRRKQRATPALAATPVLLMSAGAHLATVSGELNAAGHVTKTRRDVRPARRRQAALPVNSVAGAAVSPMGQLGRYRLLKSLGVGGQAELTGGGGYVAMIEGRREDRDRRRHGFDRRCRCLRAPG